MAKSAKEYLHSKQRAKTVVLEKDFAGIKKGQRLLIATPKIIDAYIRKIPYGQTKTIQQMRMELAHRRKSDATCPTSSAIFIRIAAQAAIDELESGADIKDITPFWRLLTSQDKIATKLTIDPKWIDQQRALEQTAYQ